MYVIESINESFCQILKTEFSDSLFDMTLFLKSNRFRFALCYEVKIHKSVMVISFTRGPFICFLMIQNCSLVLQGEEGLLSAYFVMRMDTSPITALEMVKELIQRYYYLLFGF